MQLVGRRGSRGTAVLLVIALTTACGGGEEGSATTVMPDETVSAPTTSPSPGTTSTPAATTAESAPEAVTTTTVGSTDNGDLDCLGFWSEEFVQTTAGSEFTFTDMNIDGTLCTFTAAPDSIGVFFRPGDQNLFDQAKSGASAAGGVTEIEGVCDMAWYTDLGLVVAEGYSAAQGRIFNATVVGPADPVAVAQELLAIACDGPAFD